MFYPIQHTLLFKSFATKTESATQKTKECLVYLHTAYKPNMKT